ncbi:Apoptosis-inducing factor 2 [Desmophyllum pertusum]|uniref:Apoptosis-inducing factor 2 n=1 Tax=Desmophyllum pertusum TaxID=174260 RepID=A0A9W9Z265_9CNID|nr:Apoptosis-inducing factor 2 [Desmophyllum pertusum]
MLATRLRSATPFIAAGLAAGSAAFLGYQACYSTAVHARDENLKAFKDTNVLIIGGGYGGIATAKKLKDQCNVTLIDARDAFHHNMGAQRSSVETGFANKCLIPTDQHLAKTLSEGKLLELIHPSRW